MKPLLLFLAFAMPALAQDFPVPQDTDVRRGDKISLLTNDVPYAPVVTLTAGDGLTGGGTTATDRTFAVDASVLRTGLAFVAGSNIGITGVATNGGVITISATVTTSVANTTLRIAELNTPTAETNNATGTNTLYAVHIPTNNYSKIEIDALFHVRNNTGGAHGYRIMALETPDGGSEAVIDPPGALTSALQTGGNNPGYIDGNAAFAPYASSTANLVNGGTVTLAVELDSAQNGLGAQLMHLIIRGIQ